MFDKQNTENKPSELKILISILLFSATLSIEEILTLVLNGIAVEWPEVSISAIQMVYSFMVLVEMLTAFFLGFIVSKMSKRKIIIVFNIIATLGGLFAFFFGFNIYMLYISSAVIGFACSVLSTINKSMVSELYTEDKRAKLYGLQLISTALATSAIFILGGKLVKTGWRYVYLLFLILLIPSVSAVFMLPEGEREASQKTDKAFLNVHVVKYMLIGFFFAISYMTYSTNIGFLLAEVGLGDSLAGYISAALKIASFAVGILLDKTVKVFKDFTLSFAIALVSIGFLLLYFTSSFALSLLGAVMIGIGSGIFSPQVYMQIAKKVQPTNISSSIAFVNSAISLGMFFNPYIITLGAKLINNEISSRFLLAAILSAAVGLYCFIDAKTTKSA